MEYPTLSVKAKSRAMADAFRGYNHNLRIGDNEFYDMKNMTSDYYPVLAPRGRRGVYKDGVTATGLIAKDQLCYVDGTEFVVGEERVDMGLSAEPKQLISMGAFVIILPDEKYVNTMDLEDHGSMGTSVHVSDVSIKNCDINGDFYDFKYMGYTAPAEPEDNDLWLDTSGETPVVKRYSATNIMWSEVSRTYCKIEATGIGKEFLQYDGVTISGIGAHAAPYDTLNGDAVIYGCSDDCIIVEGMIMILKAGTGGLPDFPIVDLTVERKIPKMDFIIESNNRLWGCRYGKSREGVVVNEIYACKQGDFKNWNCFMGVSTDSYRVSCGTDGPFTGAITHLGYPIFFKETCLHKVYGDYPSNFRVQNTTCRGVQKGSHGSLAVVNETLYYKAGNAVCAYDGSLPVEMSSALGETRYSDAVAGAHGNKYYIDMKTADGEYHLFVYDTAKGMWHKEDNLRVDQFCSYQNGLYGIDHDTKQIIAMVGTETQDGEKVPWMVETGLMGLDMPDMKYISRLLMRMNLEVGARVAVSIQYDSVGAWEPVCNMTVTSLRNFAVPVRLRRCDHFRIRIEGEGEGRIYSITKTIEKGSDLS